MVEHNKSHITNSYGYPSLVCTASGMCVYCEIDRLEAREKELLEAVSRELENRRNVEEVLRDTSETLQYFRTVVAPKPTFDSLVVIQAEQKEWYNKQPWAQHTKHKLHENSFFESLAGITEEVGELAHSLLKMFQGIRGTKKEHIAKAKDAVGDIIIYIMSLCNQMGWDLQTIINDTWNEVKKRDFNKDKLNG